MRNNRIFIIGNFLSNDIQQALDENNNIICLEDMNKSFLCDLREYMYITDMFMINRLVSIICKPIYFDARTGNT